MTDKVDEQKWIADMLWRDASDTFRTDEEIKASFDRAVAASGVTMDG